MEQGLFSETTRILVVDDMSTIREVLMKYLREMGYLHFQEAADGDLAWQKIMTPDNPIDLVICDWNMPNCSGLQLLKRVRANPKTANLPFLLLTAEAEAHQVKEALDAGVTNYILKPFNAEIIKTKLKAAYKRVAGAK